MSNKYIGHPGGLIGPVMIEKPHPVMDEAGTEYWHNKVNAYNQHLSSLPRIPCEGWEPEEGREYIRGVHFELNQIAECKDGGRSEWVTVAVPLPAAPPSPELDHPEEGADNKNSENNRGIIMATDPLDNSVNMIAQGTQTPAPFQEGGKTNDPFVQKHLSRIKLGLASVGASSVFIPCMPQDEGAFNLPNTNTWLREVKFDSIEAPQEGAQDWSYICKHRTFAQVLEENWQAQIAGFYNHDKTDEERKIRQAVIAEYEDLIAIYKEYQKVQPAPAAVTDAREFGDKLSDAEHFFYKHCVIFQGINAGEYLDKEDFLKYVKAIESPTYPAEFVEWTDGAIYIFEKGKGWIPIGDTEGWITTAELFTEWKQSQSK